MGEEVEHPMTFYRIFLSSHKWQRGMNLKNILSKKNFDLTKVFTCKA